jgi:putative (di)nucleoside polyphosphate hydrolase
MPQQGDEDKSTEFLLAELEHFGESLWRNEEVGEKRFNFFLTLVTAVISGLVALHAQEKPLLSSAVRLQITGGALDGLLVLGLMTYLRMLHRNRVTDEYKKTLTYIRGKLAELNPAVGHHHVPLKFEGWRRKWLRGGLAETVGALEALLVCSLLLVYAVPLVLVIPVSLATFGILWWFAAPREGESAPAEYFRAGVGAVIIDGRGLVLAFERAGTPGAWQFPQGGLEKGEEPIKTVYREIAEETGIAARDLELLAAYPDLLVYELPPSARSEKTGRGQVQYWFLFRFHGDVGAINVQHGKEFRAWQWLPFAELLQKAAAFRKPVYGRLAEWSAGYLAG